MPPAIASALAPARNLLARLSTAQKIAAAAGLLVLVVGGFLFVRWAAAPTYAPLFTGISPEDASAVVEKLDADGTPYQLTGGGTTITVPEDLVYSTRIAMSGEGLPSQKSEGYSILDDQDLSTSQFQERTGYKRAMEGELASTVGAIDGVDSAVVHLAMPEDDVFAEEQEPTTASVLVKTRPGDTLSSDQVRGVVYLVSSSVEGLKTDDVTVTDSTGKVLNAPGDEAGSSGGEQSEVRKAYEDDLTREVQRIVERVAGAGNATVQVTADMDFDRTTTDTTTYRPNPDKVTLSETRASERYEGGGAAGAQGGVVGPDGQLETDGTSETGGNGSYEKTQSTSENAVGKVVERRESAPGKVSRLNVGVVVDSQRARDVSAPALEETLRSALGTQLDRGDTLSVTTMPFDRTAEEAAAKELEAAAAAEQRGQWITWGRNALIGVGVLLALVIGLKRRKARHAQRLEATNYVVEQLRQDQVEAQQRRALETNEDRTAMLPRGSGPASPDATTREEIEALVERQPEEIAQLLRGWLVESKR